MNQNITSFNEVNTPIIVDSKNIQKFTITELYRAHTLSEIEDVFSLTNDIIENLDSIGLQELCTGYSWDIDKLFLDIVEESTDLINSGKGVQSFSFSYLDGITNGLDSYLKRLSLAYFVSSTLSDFIVESYNLEWFNLVQLNRLLCILAARGHSKSYSFSFAYPLWCLYKYKKGDACKELTVVTAEESLATSFIDKIEKEVESNYELREVIYPQSGKGAWAKSYLEAKNGFILRGKGSTSSLRGLHCDLLVDDLLDESNFYNSKVRAETIEFFNSVLMNIPLPKTGKVTVVGCVAPTTYVLDKEKGFCQIIDLLPKGADKYKQGLYDLNNKVLDSYNNFVQNTKFWVNGLCHTNKVILDNNYHIIGSDIHPLWCFDGFKEDWKKIPELKIGDIVEIKDNNEINEDWGILQEIKLPTIDYSEILNLPKYINEEIAYLLGVFCAEGSLHKNGKQVCIANQEIDFSFTKKYNIEFCSYEKGKYICSRKILREWFKELFGEDCYSENKKIPNIILNSPKYIIKAFLQGLFDGDGSCSNGKVNYTTISKILKEQLQSVLSMCFGINCNIYVYTKEQRNSLDSSIKTDFDTYNIIFDDYNSKLFLDRIGFKLERKQKYSNKNITENDVAIPTPIELLKKIKEIAQREYKIKLNGQISEQIIKRNGYLTRGRLKGIYNYFINKFDKEKDITILEILNKYSSKNWRKIREIKDNGNEYTYDFVIPSHNIFIGNGIKNHQTPFHSDDLYSYLKKKKNWRVFEYPGIYPDGRLLSPERFTLQEILDKRETIGSIAFSREILMQPVTSNMSLFPMRILKMNLVDTFKMENNKFNISLKLSKIAFGVDLAISANTDQSANADYFVVAIIGLEADTNRYWLLNIYRQRGLSYLQQMNVVKSLNDRFKPDVIMVESNQYQAAFGDMLIDNGLTNVIKRATSSKNKYDFKIGLPAVSVLFEQFRFKIPYGNDPYTRNQATIVMNEFNSMTFNDNKLQSAGLHDDTCMGIWLGITALNYVNSDLVVSFLDINN